MKHVRPLFRPFLAIAAISSMLALTGCDQDNKALRAEDDTNPYFHTATADIQERNFVEAAKSYEAALRANPEVAQAHYELGILYTDHLNDPIAALYHFEQYLKARPTGDNAQNAQERLNAAEINFAATLPNSPVQNAQAFAKLESDNQSLQRDLETATQKAADLEAKLASTQKELSAAAPNLQPTNSVPATATTPAPGGAEPAETAAAPTAPTTPAPAVAAPATAIVPATSPVVGVTSQTYTIASGDTLWKIAKKFYPGKITEGIDKIKAANTTVLVPGKPLKIGTQIQIPQ